MEALSKEVGLRTLHGSHCDSAHGSASSTNAHGNTRHTEANTITRRDFASAAWGVLVEGPKAVLTPDQYERHGRGDFSVLAEIPQTYRLLEPSPPPSPQACELGRRAYLSSGRGDVLAKLAARRAKLKRQNVDRARPLTSTDGVPAGD
jgi:hypothetical protein